MTDRYPPPSYALSIWLSGDAIMLAVPEAGTIPISLDRLEPQINDFGNVVPGNRGLAVLLDLLRARMASRAPTIGQPAAPVRYDIEQALASDEKYATWQQAMATTAEAKAEAKEFLKGLGI
jgi:hypothetical protein